MCVCVWHLCYIIQCVPLATEPGISLIILAPMKILQRNLNSSTLVVWEMKRNVSVVRFKFRCNTSHVPALWHVKEPSTSLNYECASKIPCIVPSFASRRLSCLCGAWRLWRWMRGKHWGQGYNRPTGCSADKAPHATFKIYLWPPMKMEQTERSETSVYKIQAPGNYPEKA